MELVKAHDDEVTGRSDADAGRRAKLLDRQDVAHALPDFAAGVAAFSDAKLAIFGRHPFLEMKHVIDLVVTVIQPVLEGLAVLDNGLEKLGPCF
jgi:hypothetical protein